MAVLPILPADNPKLRQKSKKVSRIDGSIQRLIDDMVETMHKSYGAGLAAPQVGVFLRVMVVELPEQVEKSRLGDSPSEMTRRGVIALINPEIVKKSGERMVEEGCLCLPGYRGKIKRSEKVTVKGRDRKGKEIRIKAEDLLAQALEHEIDHLNGIIYIDHLESPDLLRKIEPEGGAEGAETRQGHEAI